MILCKRHISLLVVAWAATGSLQAQDEPPLTFEEAKARAAAAAAEAKAKAIAAKAARAEAEALAAMAAAEAAKARAAAAAARAAGIKRDPGDKAPVKTPGAATGSIVLPATKADPEYVVKSGDLPSAIAEKIYGNPSYHRVITTYNFTNEKGLKVGEILKVPTFRVMMEKEKLVPMMEEEVSSMLEALTVFKTIGDQVRTLGKDSPGKVDAIPKDVMEKLTKVEALLRKAAAGFGTKKEGAGGVPASVFNQLKSAADKVGKMKLAQYGNRGYEVGRVHQCASYAMMYAMLWAREGHK